MSTARTVPTACAASTDPVGTVGSAGTEVSARFAGSARSLGPRRNPASSPSIRSRGTEDWLPLFDGGIVPDGGILSTATPSVTASPAVGSRSGAAADLPPFASPVTGSLPSTPASSPVPPRPGGVAVEPVPPGSVIVSPLDGGPAAGALSRYRPRPGATRYPFEWTLNPYRGCEFACGYCYARYTHGFLGLDDPRDFERRIFFKPDLAPALGRDLDRRVAPGHRIALGTATDPYQPAERRHEVTRACLQVMARRAAAGRSLRVSITTKSDLILRDLDLLRVIAEGGSLHINFSITTLDHRLARTLEPRAPTPERRLRALRTLRAEGIEAGVFLMPVLPGLTDDPGAIESLVRAASEARASYLCHEVLFLREPTRSFWLDRLAETFPALVHRYRRWYPGDASHVEGDLRESIHRRVNRARRRYRLAAHPADREAPDPQGTLSFG